MSFQIEFIGLFFLEILISICVYLRRKHKDWMKTRTERVKVHIPLAVMTCVQHKKTDSPASLTAMSRSERVQAPCGGEKHIMCYIFSVLIIACQPKIDP